MRNQLDLIQFVDIILASVKDTLDDDIVDKELFKKFFVKNMKLNVFPTIISNDICKKANDFVIEQYRCPLINDVRVNMRNITKYYDSDNYALNVKELINKFNGEKN